MEMDLGSGACSGVADPGFGGQCGRRAVGARGAASVCVVDPGCGAAACVFVVILKPAREAQLRRPLAQLRGCGKRERVRFEGKDKQEKGRQENGSGDFFYSYRNIRHRLARELTGTYSKILEPESISGA